MSKSSVVNCLLIVSFLAAPAAADNLLVQVDKTWVYCCALPQHEIVWAFGQVPGELGINVEVWNVDATSTGIPQRREIAADSYINVVYGLAEMDDLTREYVFHHFNWASQSIVTSTIAADEIFTSHAQEGAVVTSYITPPNGVTLHGTGLHFSEIEFTLSGIETDDFRTTVTGTFRYYGVPEPAAFVMVVPLALLRRRIR